MRNILILILVALIAAAGIWWVAKNTGKVAPEISVKKTGEMVKDGVMEKAEGVMEKVEEGAEAVASTTGEVMEKVEEGAEAVASTTGEVMEKVEESTRVDENGVDVAP